MIGSVEFLLESTDSGGPKGTRQRPSAGVGMGGYLAVFRKPITRSVNRPAAAWS
jgi:hypothetical protein